MKRTELIRVSKEFAEYLRFLAKKHNKSIVSITEDLLITLKHLHMAYELQEDELERWLRKI